MRSRRWQSRFLASALLCASVLVSAAERPALRDYAVDIWTTRQGLPHNSIRAIAQTPEGQLWFGTWEGLVGYNGLEFDVLDRATKPGLLDNGIGALYRDKRGDLWITDSRGNVGQRGANGELRFLPRPASLPNVLIQAMAMDKAGRLWMLYEGKGLAVLRPNGALEYFEPEADSPLRYAYTRMVLDDNERLWIGTFNGLAYRDIDGDGMARRVPEAFGLSAGLTWPYRAPDGALWIASEDRLYRMENDRPVLKYQLPDKTRLTAMLQDRHGQIWLGTENLGLMRWTERYGLERMAESLDLPGGRILQIFEDAEGSIWVGASGGLFRQRETLFNSYTEHDGLGSNYIRAVIEDRRGQLWVGSTGGLDRFSKSGVIERVALPTASGSPPSVLSVTEDAQGGVWVGTYIDGLYRIDEGGTTTRYGEKHGLPRGNIRAIAVDSDGIVWLGTQRGVARLENDRAELVQGENAPIGLITALSSQPGELWIGTIEGVRVLRGDKVQRIDLDEMGGGRTVFGFRRLGDAMWIISDRGLYRYVENTLTRVGLEQGLPVDATFELIPDQIGNVWITSNRGVVRTTQAALEAVADGREARISVERFNEMDGMVSSQANGSSGPAAWLRKDGTLWVATANGLTTVDPRRVAGQAPRTPPPTIIESLTMDGQPLPLGEASQDLSLPGGKRLSVEYVGLSFLLPERILYRTRLIGLDDDWIARGRQRNVEFIGLAPGRYELLISASHPNSPWSTREASWRFQIEPFWWQRTDVRVGSVFLTLVFLLSLYAFLVARYRSSNRRLTQQVDERTHDLQHQTQRLLDADAEKTRLLNQLQKQSEAFERQAREDVLTGLPNRRAFDLALTRALEWARDGARPLTLAILDIDHFKEVNDKYSHSTGDAVLREVGRMLSGACRANDMPARVGGEEFAVLFHDTTIEQAQTMCEALRQRFHAQRNWAGVAGLQICFSAGLTQFQLTDETEGQLLERADEALYRAKEGGRDRICIG